MGKKPALPVAPGVYKITNTVNGKFYIGSTKNLRSRWSSHKCDIRQGKHVNVILQAAWNKYGEEAMVIEVVEICAKHEIFQREQIYLDALLPPYNILKVAGSAAGRVASPQARLRMSRSQKGKVISPETRQRISDTLTGRSVPREVLEKIAATRARKLAEHGPQFRPLGPWSEERRKKYQPAIDARLGVPRSAETRAKISAAHVGMTHTEESIRRISENRRGKNLGPCSAERAENIAKAKAAMTAEQIRLIRRRCAAGEKHRDVGASFGVSKTTITYIVSRKSYKWVD